MAARFLAEYPMTASSTPDITDLNHEVQRQLGRCLIRLQQYERVLKATIAMQELSGTLESLPHALDARHTEVDGKTLGTLVGRLMTAYIVKDGSKPLDDLPNHQVGSTWMSVRIQQSLPETAYQILADDLSTLVKLRNALVHHFIDLHDLRSVEGCLRAQKELSRSYAEIDRHFEHLCNFAGEMDNVRRRISEVIQSPRFQELVSDGVTPNGKIHWPSAEIVGALREALQALSIDGWVKLGAAERWLSEHRPDQTPKSYGCSRWRHVVHASGQFELRRFTRDGRAEVWFRERPNSGS